MVTPDKVIEIKNLSVFYSGKAALNGVSFDVRRNETLAIIGPAQSGKTTLLRTLNRTIDFTPEASVEGSIKVDGEDIIKLRDPYALRRKIGMVAPLPVGLPLTIYENVAFAPRQTGLRNRGQLDELVERCLRLAALWDEVKDRLKSLGTKLSGGQQQRLTIARALSHQPDILCLDEFSIAIDPVTTMRIEAALRELKSDLTVILVTNLIQQARRLADRTAFLHNGHLIEIDDTETMFSGEASQEQTNQFVRGVFG
jgi:phosphate transport system ATP-binding protein